MHTFLKVHRYEIINTFFIYPLDMKRISRVDDHAAL